jgi:hypothetical protein
MADHLRWPKSSHPMIILPKVNVRTGAATIREIAIGRSIG